MAMFNPPHPGLVIKEILLPDTNLGMTELANHLGVSRSTLSRVANGHAEISPDMAMRLEQAFGGSADHWLRMQASYNLAQARKRSSDMGVLSISQMNRKGKATKKPSLQTT